MGMKSSPPSGDMIARNDGGCAWVISSFAQARSILVNPAARVLADPPPQQSAGLGVAGSVVARGAYLRSLWMWGCETDRRAVCRKVAVSALGPGPIEALIPELETHAAALLDEGSRQPEFDLVAGFARPLVRDALMALFGIPSAARASLDAQVGAMAGFIPGNEGEGTARYFALAAIAKLVEELWRGPLPPLAATSRRLRDAVEAGELSLDEALAQATLLLFGNSYTTLDALAGLLARLAERPSLWRDARSGSISPAALVEESLRLGPPTHLVLFRDAAREIACAEGVIPAGARIVMPLDHLNRDPACFADADTFDPGRSGPPHLAFGAGQHMCVGQHLARAVIRTGVGMLLKRLPALEARIASAPGILGGESVSTVVIRGGALAPC